MPWAMLSWPSGPQQGEGKRPCVMDDPSRSHRGGGAAPQPLAANLLQPWRVMAKPLSPHHPRDSVAVSSPGSASRELRFILLAQQGITSSWGSILPPWLLAKPQRCLCYAVKMSPEPGVQVQLQPELRFEHPKCRGVLLLQAAPMGRAKWAAVFSLNCPASIPRLQNRDENTSVHGKGAGKIDGLFEKLSETNDERHVAARAEINTLGSTKQHETWVPK